MTFAPQRILAVKLADLGDVLLATPALRALRQTYPDARIDALVTPHTSLLIQHSGLVDRVITFPKHAYDTPRALLHPGRLWRMARLYATIRSADYDAVALFHHLSTGYGLIKWRLLVAAAQAPVVAGLDNGHGGRWLTHPVPDRGFGAQHEVEYALAVAGVLGASTTDTAPALPPFVDEETRARRWLGDESRPYLVIHAGSGGYSQARRWNPGHFAVVADALAQQLDLRIVIVGTASDDGDAVAAAMKGPALNLQGQTDLPDLVALLRRCALFIGADSGVMHVAAAVGAPVVAIFGPSNHRAWAPWAPPERVAIIRPDIPCSPCTYVGTRVAFRGECDHRSCMAGIAPAQVIAAAVSVERRAWSVERQVGRAHAPVGRQTARSTLYAPRFTLHASHFTLHASRSSSSSSPA